eukprot:TRINITY_DN6538_c0_g1_i1.p1 TRINITY_DN6538_c0_g1~~TRINITY_DN6538_c0_g1_i1.p1  ORF type:complete len:573 (-),score=118.25 TRINITY_DN6538_c0_g1_i1:194-1912(-)
MGSCVSTGAGCLVGCTGGIVATTCLWLHRTERTSRRKLPKELAYLRGTAEKKEESTDAEWLNVIIKELWPRIDVYVRDLVKTSIEPSIASKLKGAFSFSEVKLGSSFPKFGPLLVNSDGQDRIEMEVGVDITTEMVIAMHVAGIPVGVKELVFRGVMSIVMQGKSTKPPFFPGVVMYFANAPQVDVTFTGLASLADHPSLKGVVRSAISGALGSRLVLPNRIAVDMDADDAVEAFEMARPVPAGVLTVKVQSGKGLLACDQPFFGSSPGTSDPYVIMEAAGGPFKTPTIKATLEPVWTKDNEYHVFVYSKSQTLSFTIYDEDWGEDDLMGEVQGVKVEQLMTQSGGKPVDMELTVQNQGTLTISTLWLPLSRQGPSKELTGPQLYLAVMLDHCTGLPANGSPPYTVTVQVTNDFAATTKPSFATEAKLLSDEVQAACVKLSDKGMTFADIAEVLDITEQQARITVNKVKHPSKAQEALDRTSNIRATKTPQFQDVVEMLLPWTDSIGKAPVTINLKDKHHKLVGSVSAATVGDLVASCNSGECEEDGIDGPFMLGTGMRLVGHMRTRWLAAN